MKRKTGRWLVILMVVGLAAGTGAWFKMRKVQAATNLPTAKARKGEFLVIVRCRGDLAAARSVQVTAPVRWEPGVPTDPESMVFPHLYGPLPVEAVTRVTPYRPQPDGSFSPLAAP